MIANIIIIINKCLFTIRLIMYAFIHSFIIFSKIPNRHSESEKGK